MYTERSLRDVPRVRYTARVRPFPASLRRSLENDGAGLTVLVLRMSAFGDILRTLPAVRLVRFALPDARIHWAVDERWAMVLEHHPDLDGCLKLPRREWAALARSPRGWPALLASVRRVVREMRSLRPGLALDFHGNLRSGLLGRLSGAPVRVGYSGHQQKEGNRVFSTHRVPAGERRRSRMERNLDLVRALGIPDRPLPDGGIRFTRSCLREARDAVAERIGRGRRYAVLAAGASRGQAYKKPPAPLLAAAARALEARGVASLVAWGPGEEEDAAAVVHASGGAAVPAPPTDLRLLASVVRRATLVVSGDSGPLHLACAAGRPVVALYGPTDPAVNAPWGVPHEIVHPPERVYTGVKSRDRRSGFEGLAGEAVAAAVLRLLDRLEPGRPGRATSSSEGGSRPSRGEP